MAGSTAFKKALPSFIFTRLPKILIIPGGSGQKFLRSLLPHPLPNLIFRLDQIDELIEANAANERNIDAIFRKMKFNFQKYSLVKYDAFNEMGGKLSFSLAMLNEKNDGYIINAVHSREGCYTYVKEIIDGNSIIALAEEEEQALQKALESNQ